MAHHFEDRPANEELLRRIREATGVPSGATGEFPEGKIAPNDKGEIACAIAGDPKLHLVHIDFGDKPITWLSMTPQQAVAIAQSLIAKARLASAEPLRVVIE